MRNFKDIEELIRSLVMKETSKVFIFAGAGSGKTYTLVKILEGLKEAYGVNYAREGRTVGVITYTNAAVDEIKRRIFYDSLFAVSTIHSFIWECIKDYQKEIKRTFLRIIEDKISELSDEIAKKTKATVLQRELEDYRQKKEEVEKRNRFTYSPGGTKSDMNSLNHSEVIKIGTYMIKNLHKVQKVIAAQYPFILVDESQDTNKLMVEALFEMKKVCGDRFCLIMIGDEKQRIYMDGVKSLSKDQKNYWDSFTLRVNHRSDNRIVTLGNNIASRIEEDASLNPKQDAGQGYVRLFLCPVIEDFHRQEEIEKSVIERMASITKDSKWVEQDVKILILEHKLAALRLGFLEFFEAINSVDSYKSGFLAGNISEMAVFKNLVVPLHYAIASAEKEGENHQRLNIIKKYTNFSDSSTESNEILKKKRSDYVKAVKRLEQAIVEDQSIGNIVKIIIEEEIYSLHAVLSNAVSDGYSDENAKDEEKAWHRVLSLPISHVLKYYNYIGDHTKYGTQQGVKGLQFDRVLCIIDDKHTRGNSFSFEKLLGVKELSKQDVKNIEAGKENVNERTLRLFYVICTRARKSLAIIAYTEKPEKAKNTAIKNGWFEEEEIEIWN